MIIKIFRTFGIMMIFTLLSHSEIIANNVIEIDITIKDHVFSPNVIEVEPGKKIRITVHNQDNTMEEFESFDLKREKIIPPKSSSTIILAPLKNGKYYFFGEFHEETANGYLIVKENNVKNSDSNF
ncbi:MAG: cupredoxin domain-containing protein [Rickettsiaceae bacterium]